MCDQQKKQQNQQKVVDRIFFLLEKISTSININLKARLLLLHNSNTHNSQIGENNDF